MLTKSDFKQLKKIFVTKDEFKEELNKVHQEFGRVRGQFGRVDGEFEKIDREFKNLRNDIVQFKDDILSEIVKLREDMIVIAGYRPMLENHEERIERLEKAV